MALLMEQIEHLGGRRSHSRKWMKNQRNRKIRRTKESEIPETKKYNGWEY